MKARTECGETKSLDEFYPQATTRDRRKSACKACGRRRARAFYRAHRENFLNYAKTYMKDPANRKRSNSLKQVRHSRDPRRRIVMHARIRARRAGLPFDISIDDIDVPSHCPALGIPLRAGGDRRQHDSSPTIDRVIPALGYVRGNVTVISWRANRIKSDATLADLEGILAYLRQAVTALETPAPPESLRR